MAVTVAILICTQWRIYLQWYVADIHVGLHVEVATLQANGADCRPQYTPTCLESSDCSRSSECKNLILTPFLAGIITLETVLQGDAIYDCYDRSMPKAPTLNCSLAYSQSEEEANAGLRSWKTMNNRCIGLSVKRQSQQSHDASLSANEGERSVEDEVSRKLSGY